MTKPLLLLDQHFRKKDELFSPEAFAGLGALCRIEGGEDRPMERSRLEELLPEAEFLVAARPALTAAQIDRAARLRATIEVSGAFHSELDYAACFNRGIEVLSCSPGFQRSVAEMGLAMILAGGRGLVAEHEAFRVGKERWLDDRAESDFTLFGQSIGFVGYGKIARELHRLLAPFSPKVGIHDPWLGNVPEDVEVCSLEALFSRHRVVVVTAAPTAENRAMIGAEHIARMPSGALLVLLGRAHVIDFEAALKAAASGGITFATDVFPSEPVQPNDPLRGKPGLILSPHRAAAVPGGRQLIGDMIVHDVRAIMRGSPERLLQAAHAERIDALVEAQRLIEQDGRLHKT